MTHIIISSILSGILISLSGMLYIIITWISPNSLSEIFNIIGSLLFSIGLLTICRFKLHLFTGKIGLVFEHNHEWYSAFALIKLLMILILNLSASVICGLIAHFALRKTYFDTLISLIISNKIKFAVFNNYIKCFIQSVYCGSCVHLAIKTFPHHFLFCVFFVSAFVYNNFQHCIANAFYFASSYTMNVDIIINELLVISGNIIGTIPIAFINNKINSNRVDDDNDDNDEIMP